MSTLRLKPCPFCGQEVAIVQMEPRLYRLSRNHPYTVVCNGCCLFFGYDEDYGGQFDSREEAAEVWNKRV